MWTALGWGLFSGVTLAFVGTWGLFRLRAHRTPLNEAFHATISGVMLLGSFLGMAWLRRWAVVEGSTEDDWFPDWYIGGLLLGLLPLLVVWVREQRAAK